MKFGGSSVATAENWATIAGLVRNRLESGLQPVIVHSALQGVSNALAALLDTAATGDSADGVEAIRERHFELAADLDLDAHALIGDQLHELEQLASAGACSQSAARAL